MTETSTLRGQEIKQFKLPDVGEGLTEAEIVRWHVAPGDHVEVNQTIVEIETAKAIVELPCPFEGVVASLHADEGQTVDVGVPIISVDVSGGGSDAGGGTARPGTVPAAVSGESPGSAETGRATPPAGRDAALREGLVPSPPSGQDSGPGEEGGPTAPAGPPKRTPVLVGYGVKPGATKRRPRRGPSPDRGDGAVKPPTTGAGGPARTGTATGDHHLLDPAGSHEALRHAGGEVLAGGAHRGDGTGGGTGGAIARPQPVDNGTAPGTAAPGAVPAESRPLAKPPVRKMARDLGVDLRMIPGTGPQGSITRQDVLGAAGVATTTGMAEAAGTAGTADTAVAPLGTGPTEERIPVRGVRKQTAVSMVASAFTAPHVTEFLQVDVTESMEAVRRLRDLPEFSGVKVTPMLLVAKALLLAVRRHPMINSTWAGDEIIVKRHVNLGIAAATERGLLVPNVKNAQDLPLVDLARALAGLTETARTGRTAVADLTGGTISITNVGVLGVDTGTPILPPGEAAILAFGQVRDMPWVHQGEIKIRKVSTLALSFDHRIVDGDLGSAVLRDVGAALEDPLRLIAWS